MKATTLLAGVVAAACAAHAEIRDITVHHGGHPVFPGRPDLPAGTITLRSGEASASAEIALPFKGDPSRLKTVKLGGRGARPSFGDGKIVFRAPTVEGACSYTLYLEPEKGTPLSETFEIGGAVFRTGALVTAPGMEIEGTGRRSRNFRIPGVAETRSGALVAVFDIRYNNAGDLPEDIDVGVSVSRDGGATWSPVRVAIPWRGTPGGKGVGDPAILYDAANSRLWIAALRAPECGHPIFSSRKGTCSPAGCGQLLLSYSDDEGGTWSAPVNATGAVKRPGDADTAEWGCLFQGPGAGIAMRDGTLVFPAQVWGDRGRAPHHGVLVWSKDGGRTWHSSKAMPFGGSESTVAETAPGELLLNTREGTRGRRTSAVTRDLGETWEKIQCDIPQPVSCCQGAALAADGTLYFSNPASAGRRDNMTLRKSEDGGRTWSAGEVYDARPCAGYSSLCTVGKDRIGVLYEGDSDWTYFISVPRGEVK